MTTGTSVLAAASRLLQAFVLCASAGTTPAHADGAGSLKARHAALREQLASNQFQRSLYLVSGPTADSVKGDVYAVLGQPDAVLGAALQDIPRWCDFLILHPPSPATMAPESAVPVDRRQQLRTLPGAGPCRVSWTGATGQARAHAGTNNARARPAFPETGAGASG